MDTGNEKEIDFDLYTMLNKRSEEMKDFYVPFFENENDLNRLMELASDYDDKNSQIRLSILQIYNFVSLANDIETIRPARDPLRIFFLKTCMDSLYNISGENNKKTFYKEFEKSFSEEGKSYILSHFKYMGLSIFEKMSPEQIVKNNKYNKPFKLNHFLNLMKAVRDMVVHDGDYWSTQFFAQDDDSFWSTEINTKEDILETGCKEQKEYSFYTTLEYSKFIDYFVEACVRFICKKHKNLICGQENN
ncbi:MAG: hypothetical protein IKH09_08940 [Clostridia bacterium]|nr:hypothetical protein [Clostridia bacterium]